MKARFATCAALFFATGASAQTIAVRFTNNQPTGGFSTSPVFVGVHDGTFDMFNSGSAASPALEALAELGDSAGLASAINGHGVSGSLTTPAPTPQFTPGESRTINLNVTNPATHRFFSFASMFVPSNDFFVGNDNPLQYPVFNTNGSFAGPLTIMISGTGLWEAQTEVNSTSLGIAFVTGQNATLGTAQTGSLATAYRA